MDPYTELPAMKKASAISTLFGFALLAGLVWALWYVARAGVALFNGAGLFDGVPRPTLVILATSAITLLLAAWMISGGLRAIARREETAQRRDARAAAYEVFLQSRAAAAAVDGVFAVRGAVVPVEHSGAHELLLLHASPAVLGAYARLRRAEESGGDARDEMAEMIRAMRRDLGQRAPDAPLAEIAELIDAAERKSGFGKEGLTRSQRS
jgi:hypothetical protein